MHSGNCEYSQVSALVPAHGILSAPNGAEMVQHADFAPAEAHANPLTAEKRSGQLCIRDLRLTVHDVLEYLASGMDEAEILLEFPDLRERDFITVYAAAAAELQCAEPAYSQFSTRRDARLAAKLVANRVAAERERCAGVAEARVFRNSRLDAEMESYNLACECIAATIREVK